MKLFSLTNENKHQGRFIKLAAWNLAIILLVLIAVGAYNLSTVLAAPQPVSVQPQAKTGQHGGNCMLCHGIADFTGTLASGEKINLTVSGDSVKNNLHLRLGACEICHNGFTDYPHPNSKNPACSQCHVNGEMSKQVSVTLPFENSRKMVAEMNSRCHTCHQVESVAVAKGKHADILNSGNLSAPLCSDCHGSHSVQKVETISSSQYCAKCHDATYNSFEVSVHGASLAKKMPNDALTCAVCHGNHTLNGPSDPEFRKEMVNVCLKCHQDKIMMNRYQLPADIFDAGVDSYHAVKVEVVAGNNLTAVGDTPVCIDCHGVHSIMSSKNPGSTVSSANLLTTCLKCHAGQADFILTGKAHISSAGTSAVGVISQAFWVIIPVGFGLVVVFIVLDIFKRNSERKQQLANLPEGGSTAHD
jgi:hypothetical protein